MKLLYSKPVVEDLFLKNQSRLHLFKNKTGRLPKLCVLLIGKDPASQIYIKHKENACNRLGLLHETIFFEENVSESTVIEKVNELNENSFVDGILIQRPLPKQFDNIEVV